ncbi:MAG: hypothetical protein KTR28_03915 [Micavibrio sp.]|nr:hypothetical protein [Micavibrio sp.]
MLRFICILVCMFVFLQPNNVGAGESKCEMWVTFYNLDVARHKKDFKKVAKYIEDNKNLSVISGGNLNVERLYNYCLDVVDDKADAEFETLFKTFFEQKWKAGLVTLESKSGRKATITN